MFWLLIGCVWVEMWFVSSNSYILSEVQIDGALQEPVSLSPCRNTITLQLSFKSSSLCYLELRVSLPAVPVLEWCLSCLLPFSAMQKCTTCVVVIEDSNSRKTWRTHSSLTGLAIRNGYVVSKRRHEFQNTHLLQRPLQETNVTVQYTDTYTEPGHRPCLQNNVELTGFKAFRGHASWTPVLTAFFNPYVLPTQLRRSQGVWRGSLISSVCVCRTNYWKTMSPSTAERTRKVKKTAFLFYF